MARAKLSRHHQVCTSMLGSDEPPNCIDNLTQNQHDPYHKWGSNRPPCFNMRLAAINGTGERKWCLPPAALENICQITTMYEWAKLYIPEALISVGGRGSLLKHVRAAEFEITFWRRK